ncbi:esterase/lipase family protein [Solidesulfovibrio aerotolerans]|uniref:esterase/lipase family protein n=1 Tax=Solidesulfovibrio aerotolerans TaxID=295255 RepID=UPI001BAB5D65|nr:alpha/beta hydrolase [Solidesulfovibrio aerotolerans]
MKTNTLSARCPLPKVRCTLPALLVLMLAVGVFVSGCARVSIREVPIAQRYDALDRSAINSDRPSELTLAFLKQRDLDGQWKSDPDSLITALDAKYQADPGPGTLFALIELTHLQAKRYAAQPEQSAPFDLSCAVYSYLFLFDPKVAPDKGYLRPNARLAAEFHNRSLSRYLLYARAAGIGFSPGQTLATANASVELKDREYGLAFAPDEISSYHLAYEYAVSGLDVTYTVPGLGVPLILVREAGAARDDRPEERFLTRVRQVLAATLFLRIETEPATGRGGRRVYRSRLELYDPMRVNTVAVDGMTVPLETDISTPLAWMAAHAPAPQGIKGLMDPQAFQSDQGLYMLQPYQKDKIPVVFVHGLISSPMTWLPMINGLMGDPKLRERYQFWYFSYPTGNPVLYSSMLLRQALLSAQATFDPTGSNPAFNNMLIVGHSMGGLLTKDMVQDCGDLLWNTISKTPVAQLALPPDIQEQVEKLFFFKRLPFVTEVIFISTPHRGSEMALGTIGKIGKALVTLPLTLVKASATLFTSLARHGMHLPITGVPTGIDGLSPKNPLLELTAAMPVAVPFHSIIGNEAKGGVAGGSDGVVPYRSSHLDGAASELIVKSGHGAHEHPLAIREVRRIMLEHMRTTDAATSEATVAPDVTTAPAKPNGRGKPAVPAKQSEPARPTAPKQAVPAQRNAPAAPAAAIPPVPCAVPPAATAATAPTAP